MFFLLTCIAKLDCQPNWSFGNDFDLGMLWSVLCSFCGSASHDQRWDRYCGGVCVHPCSAGTNVIWYFPYTECLGWNLGFCFFRRSWTWTEVSKDEQNGSALLTFLSFKNCNAVLYLHVFCTTRHVSPMRFSPSWLHLLDVARTN
jgi:hypothetical protein